MSVSRTLFCPLDGCARLTWSRCTGKLLQLVTNLGKRKWDEVAEQMQGKKAHQCRDRFEGKVRSHDVHMCRVLQRASLLVCTCSLIVTKHAQVSGKDQWEEYEDRVLAAAQSRLGDRWQEIAKHVHGRYAVL